jgi:hypothetical protein
MIYVVWGPPRSGKTTIVTGWMIEAMEAGVQVFSNYPIFCKKTGTWSIKWEKPYALEVIRKAKIVIDEAYMDYGSRSSGSKYAKTQDISKAGMTRDEHLFFATNGHNQLDIYVIVQNPARADVIIREMCNIFYRMDPIRIPFTWWLNKKENTDIIIGITVRGYDTEQAMALAQEPYCLIRYWRTPFSLINKAFAAFDTHFYKKEGEMRTDYPRWYDPKKEELCEKLA